MCHFVLVMHTMLDLTSGFGTVSVKMQHTHATILELPVFHQEMKSTLINIQNMSTIYIQSFVENFDEKTFVFKTAKREIKLKGVRLPWHVPMTDNEAVTKVDELDTSSNLTNDHNTTNIKDLFRRCCQGFLDDAMHNLEL